MGLKISSGGGSDGRYALGQNADINVTPFVDVMLVILIIFMVAIPAAQTSIRLNLPQAGSRAQDHPHAPLVISVQAGGGVFVGDTPAQIATLAAQVTGELACRSERLDSASIHVRADRRTPYGDFVTVMDALHAAGFHHVGLVAEKI